ncbi:glutamine synthetase family protein [Neptunomonas sp.]|uniref:glutamine synthetase family protein n=1 Tax=Neptunomonas sp. TaxID=1971898 RepID=UPI0025CD44EF|nr:glutamine synthetase family protein [Neptunomonas sp.]
MNAMLTLEELKQEFATGSIDTVLACMVDMQGRLMGKRFHADYFINHAVEETHSCNYLLATDLEMETVEGYKSTSWEAGYGDYVMKPDMSTLRRVPWLEGTALVLCDVLDHHHNPIPHSPRAILRKQIERLSALGIQPMMATELEFFLFDQSYAQACESGYRGLKLASAYNEDYHIFQTTKEEGVIRAMRNGIYGAGIAVECSKGEASAGQEEINIKYDKALTTADQHSIVKNACKEIAWAHGKAITFMAKWDNDAAGSSSHVHQSMWSLDGHPLFLDESRPHGMSELMCHYLAGLLAHADDVTCLLAPYINSYKRFQEGTFAPTKAVWSLDNRTAGFRLCGEGTKAIRIECRIGGADLNPYLALAGQLAAGIAGIEQKLVLEPEFVGDAYAGENARQVPNTLRAATEKMNDSSMLREAFGDDVVDHYVHAARWEQKEHDKRVTDWEIARGFERA